MRYNPVLSAAERMKLVETLKYFQELLNEKLREKVVDINEIDYLKDEVKFYKERLGIKD